MSYRLDWAEVLVDGERPTQRGGHSTVACEGQLVIFGGSSYEAEGKFKYYDDTFVLDTKNRAWYKVKCSGESPAARYGHSVEVVGSRMFVFGGKGEAGVLRDTAFLDLVEWTWVPVSVTSASPPPRCFHASLLVGRKIVVHGGWDAKLKCLGDLWVFNTDSFTWIQPRTEGLAPCPRYGHCLELLGDGRILCFGGATVSSQDPVPRYHDDLRQLDTETMAWTKPLVDGAGPAPSGRYGLRSAQLEDGVAYFGGWGLGGNQTADCKQKGAGSFFLLTGTSLLAGNSHVDAPHGGGTAQPGLSWIRPAMPAAPLLHKYGHTMTAIQGTLYVFGGWTGKQACNDLVEITLTPND